MDDIKNKLLEMQRNILEAIESDRNQSNSAITDDIGDDIDHANEERYRELYQLMCERDQFKLEQIKLSLERIDDETYGFCEECEEKIAKARLVALPFARMCINCKTEQERLTGN